MKVILLFLLALFTALTGSAQVIQDSTLTRFADHFQSEKTYLHYDKAAYAPGETVWFKAYLMEELSPAAKSKTLYTDFISPDGKVLAHIVSPLLEGATNGQFEIPEDYANAYFHVRSYTKWNLNFDSTLIYHKTIPVIGVKTSQPRKNTATIEFKVFPEGGDLVAGILNRMAFKATDGYGLPITLKATLQDSTGKIIDSLRFSHDGMGIIAFTPLPEMKYRVEWSNTPGRKSLTTVPSAKSSGIVLMVMNKKGEKHLTLNGNDAFLANNQEVSILGTMNGRVAFKSKARLNKGESARRIIPTANLPSGIITITVFDALGNPIAERLSFIDNGEYKFPLTMEVERWGMSKRARNEIAIKVPEGIAQGSLSVSVTDLRIETDSSNNIISHFLLSSDLKGYIHNPSYYFSSAPAVEEHRDLLMLTHGWRRIKWEELAKGQLPKVRYPRDSIYLTLSGQLFGVARSALSGNETLALFVKHKDSSVQLHLLNLEKDATFNDPTFLFFDTLQVFYQVKSKLLKNVDARFLVNRLPAPEYSNSRLSLFGPRFLDTTGTYAHAQLAAQNLKLLQEARGRMMETVTIRAKAKNPIDELEKTYTSGLFSSPDAYQFDLRDDALAMARGNVLAYLQGKVAGLQIGNAPMGGEPSLSWRGGTPALYLDEIPIDAGFMNTISTMDIAYIKVFRPPFMGPGGGGGGGAIAVYTKKGADQKNTGKGLSNNKVAGYTLIREFYSPSYTVPLSAADLRTTLYWNAVLNFDSNKRILRFNFYNNDVTKAFRVIITGMSAEGYLTHHEEILE